MESSLAYLYHCPPSLPAADVAAVSSDPVGAVSNVGAAKASHHSAPVRPGQGGAASEGGTATSTSVLEITETKTEKDPSDGDRFAHFVRRDRVNNAVVSGQAVVALCGKVWIPLRDPSAYPVCPRCKALRDEIGKFGPSWPFSNSGDGNSSQA